MLNVIKTEFPHLNYKLVCEKLEVNGKPTNVVRGIMLQSPTRIPGVSLQICLFHVKRNFRREITGGNYNITSSEREEYLEYMQRMVHAVGEDDYQDIKEEFMDNCPHASVR